MRRPPYGQGLTLMQIAAAVVGSAAAAQVIAPRMQHVAIDFGNGEGADYWARTVKHDAGADELRLTGGYADDGTPFMSVAIPLLGGTWTVDDAQRS